MQRARWFKIKELWKAAEKQPEQGFDEWLRSQCGDDEDLYQKVLSLHHQDKTDSVFENNDALEPMAGDLAGTLLGPWRLLRELGSGGMGSVWLAERADAEFVMKAAIKLIKNEKASTDIIKRFRRERQILADLKHPNISMLLDGGTTPDGMPYLVMEYVDGLLIDSWRLANAVSPRDIMQIFRQVCLAVGYAHQKGVLHRDIKPANIMITSDGLPKLMDFGIANKRSEGDDHRAQHLLTPEYSPPESLVGGGKTRSADIYSLGLVLFLLLTGKRPRSAFGKWAEEMRAMGTETGQELLLEVSGLLELMLMRDPNQRIQSVEGVVAELDRILTLGQKSDASGVFENKITYDAFLWYHPNQRETVEGLARRLEDETGLKLWLDLWHLVPGEVEAQALAAAYQESACMLVLVGSDGILPWDQVDQRGALTQEWLAEKGRVVPVLLPAAARPERESGMPTFLRRRTWLSLGSVVGHDDLEVLARAIRGLPPGRRELITPEQPFLDVCPFRGLEVFREKDQQFYYGREALTQRLFDHVNKHHFLAVLGPSGSGKSSVVQAGLLPLLRSKGTPFALFTPSHKPLEELSFALAPILDAHKLERSAEQIQDSLYSSDVGLLNLLGALGANKPFCLVVDQFEEVFTLNQDRDQAERFINSLLYAVENADHVYVVLTMRSDFLGKCANWPELNHFVIDNMAQVESMTDDELASAILEPARQVGLGFEEGLAERILEEVRGASGVLPLMEHALLELYERRENNLLTTQAFREIGGVEGALATRAEAEFMRLDDESRGLLRKMFIHCLVQPGEGSEDTRRRATRGELLAEGTDKVRIEALLNQWVDAHLLTSHFDARRGEDMVDVAHEALIAKWNRIHHWMDADRETARVLARLRRNAKTWQENGRDPDILLRGAPLLRMVELLEYENLLVAQLERDFVAAGVTLREAEQEQMERQRRRELEVAQGLAFRARLIAGLTLVGLLTVGLLAFRLYNAQAAERKKAEALQEVSNYVTNLFKLTASGQERGENLTAKELVDRGARDLEVRLKGQGETRARLLAVLGSIYFNMGNYEESLRMRLELLHSVEGTHYYQERVTYANAVTATYLELSQLEEARQLGEVSRALAVEKLGASLELADAVNLLGVVYCSLGEYKKSEPYLEKGLLLRRQLLGEKHEDVAASLNELASLFELMGKFSEAETLYRQVLDMRLKLFGKVHILVAEARGALGGCFLSQYRLEEAEAQIQEALDMRRNLLGEDHPVVLETYSDLAVTYQRKGDFKKAEEAYRHVLEVSEQNLPAGHNRLALAQHNLAAVLVRNGRLGDETEGLLKKALDTFRESFGEDHERVAAVLFDLAMLYQKQGRYQVSETFCLEALNTRRRQLGNKHTNVAHSLYQYGDLLTRIGRFEEANTAATEAHAVYSETIGDETIFTIIATAIILQCNVDQKSFEKVEHELAECWARMAELQGPTHSLTERVYERLLDVCQRANRQGRVSWWKEQHASRNPK